MKRKNLRSVVRGVPIGSQKLSMKEKHYGLMMMMHFPQIQPGDVKSLSCEVCSDYEAEVCPGRGLQGLDVCECMAEESKRCVFGGDFIEDQKW